MLVYQRVYLYYAVVYGLVGQSTNIAGLLRCAGIQGPHVDVPLMGSISWHIWAHLRGWFFRCYRNPKGSPNPAGWWFQPTPLKNMRERQLGWWHSILTEWKNHKIPWFQTTNISRMVVLWCVPTFSNQPLQKSNFPASGKIRPNPSTHGFYEIITGIYIYIYGWWFQPLWTILVSWDYCSQCMEK